MLRNNRYTWNIATLWFAARRNSRDIYHSRFFSLVLLLSVLNSDATRRVDVDESTSIKSSTAENTHINIHMKRTLRERDLSRLQKTRFIRVLWHKLWCPRVCLDNTNHCPVTGSLLSSVRRFNQDLRETSITQQSSRHMRASYGAISASFFQLLNWFIGRNSFVGFDSPPILQKTPLTHSILFSLQSCNAQEFRDKKTKVENYSEKGGISFYCDFVNGDLFFWIFLKINEETRLKQIY